MSAEQVHGLRDGTRVALSGAVTDAEIVAVLLALDAAATADAAAARKRPRPPAWQRAARLENLGRAPLSSARDLAGAG